MFVLLLAAAPPEVKALGAGSSVGGHGVFSSAAAPPGAEALGAESGLSGLGFVPPSVAYPPKAEALGAGGLGIFLPTAATEA